MTQADWGKGKIDSYVVLDANLIWTPNKHLELMLAGQNLLSSSQLQYRSEYSDPGHGDRTWGVWQTDLEVLARVFWQTGKREGEETACAAMETGRGPSWDNSV